MVPQTSFGPRRLIFRSKATFKNFLALRKKFSSDNGPTEAVLPENVENSMNEENGLTSNNVNGNGNVELSVKEKLKMPAKERFSENSDGWTIVREGDAEVLFPSLDKVFYNPVQEFNRDISSRVLQVFADEQAAKQGETENQGITVLEALAASGLRSIRFAKEVRGLKSVVANDWSKQAAENIKRNVSHCNIEDTVQPHCGDAAMLMYQHRSPKLRFSAIDLDPYGSPSPFLDSAVQAVSEGGLLSVTATDMAILCGNSPESCHAKYGAVSLKSKACHEIGLRILLQAIESHANRHGRYIQPLLSLSVDFYCRVFVKVWSGQQKCKESTSKLGHVYQCTGCEALAFQRLGIMTPHKNGLHIKFGLPPGPPVDRKCKFCNQSFHIGGPIWLAPIHDRTFVTTLFEHIRDCGRPLGTMDRIVGVLSMVLEELEDVPLYYDLSRLCNITKQSQGRITAYLSAFLNAGYRVSLTHANKKGLKTDAPNEFIWAMMRAWAKSQGKGTSENLAPNTPGRTIMESGDPLDSTINFEEHPLANPDSRKKSLKRFQMNPEANWGPKTKSKTSLLGDTEISKAIRNQSKKSKHRDKEPSKKPRLE